MEYQDESTLLTCTERVNSSPQPGNGGPGRAPPNQGARRWEVSGRVGLLEISELQHRFLEPFWLHREDAHSGLLSKGGRHTFIGICM